MNAQEQIARLESLLERVRRKAAAPRQRKAAAPAPAVVIAAAPARAEDPPSPAPAPRTSALRTSPAPARVVEAPPMPSPEPVAIAPPMSAVLEPAPPEIEELDMMDADIVELGEEATQAGASDLDEPAPESAPRPAAPVLDALDLEPPVKTPPPESGRQEVTAPPADDLAPIAAASRDELEADLSGARISQAAGDGPTMEQLGETVELEGADKPADLELAAPIVTKMKPVADDLELSLPERDSPPGAYDERLASPPEAASELARPRRGGAEIAPPVSMAFSSSVVDASAETVRATRPLIVERPALESTHVAEFVLSKPGKIPETFAELLDGSLGLRAG